MAYQGVRATAVLHLRWEDVDLEGKLITWPASTDKMGRTWSQPLREKTLETFTVARQMRAMLGYTGPFVIFSMHRQQREPTSHGAQLGTYRLTSLTQALHAAERRAGIQHQLRRATHGFRRKVAGDIYDATKDVVAAMEFIGDSSLRMAETYIKSRLERSKDAAAAADLSERERRQVTAKRPRLAFG
jgi:integrase